MYKDYKIVCCTAAGRRRYMQYLFPYIVAEPLIDRYDIWVNTVDRCDIEFFKMMAARYPKVNLVRQPDGVVDGIKSINRFYNACVAPDTIYIKIDDDIVWMEPGIFGKLIALRVDHPDDFLVSPMVVNNALCSYIWQVSGKLDFGKYMNALSNHRILWKKGEFSYALHSWFLQKLRRQDGSYEALHVGDVPIAINRFSINFILWFGRDFARFDGTVFDDDEEYLSVIKPTELHKTNRFDGDALVSHFAFHSQREVLDGRNILEQYGSYLQGEFKKNPEQSAVFDFVQQCLAEIKQREAEIRLQPLNYKTVKPTVGKEMKRRFKKWQKRFQYVGGKLMNVHYVIRDFHGVDLTKKEAVERIPIVCCIDGNFISQFMTTMASVFYNNRDVHFDIHLIAVHISDMKKLQIQEFVASRGQQIFFYTADPDLIKTCPIPPGGRLTVSTYMRCFITRILPQEVSKVLYLDCDLVVRSSLKDLWNTDISDCALGVVDDMWATRGNCKRLNYPEEYSYFNAGVLLINLDYWRKVDTYNLSLDYIRKYSDRLYYNDQDILNGLFYDKKKYLSPRYNMQDGFYRRRRYVRSNVADELDRYLSNPAILHFTGNHKPWDYKCYHPLRREYFKYLGMTPYADLRSKVRLDDWVEMHINRFFWTMRLMKRKYRRV